MDASGWDSHKFKTAKREKRIYILSSGFVLVNFEQVNVEVAKYINFPPRAMILDKTEFISSKNISNC